MFRKSATSILTDTARAHVASLRGPIVGTEVQHPASDAVTLHTTPNGAAWYEERDASATLIEALLAEIERLMLEKD